MLILRVCRTQTQFPEFSYRLLSVDTAYGERQQNSWSAATAWAIWHDKEEAPRAMLTHAWRGLPRLRGVPDSPNNAAERKGLVEHVYEMAVNYTPVNPHPPGLFRPPAR